MKKGYHIWPENPNPHPVGMKHKGKKKKVSKFTEELIAQLLEDTVGDEGRKYFPFVFTILCLF